MKSILISFIYVLVYLMYFSTGTDKVTKKVANGNVVDNFSIEELLHNNTGSLLSANTESLKLRSSWTYEKGPGISPAGSDKRNYSRVFFDDRSRFVCWEITLEHNSAPGARDLNFIFSLFDETGEEMANSAADSWIPSNAEFSDHSACWGWSYANNWEKGDYYFVVKPETVEAGNLKDLGINIAFSIR